MVISELYKSEPLAFNMVKNEMVADNQDQLENEWIEQLKEKYPVKINKAVFEEIRKKINNE